MTILYVSDLLSDLIGASEVRDIVRAQCERILEDVPLPTAERMRSALRYIGGKCMGYPAVWLTSTALELDTAATADLLQRHPGPLYISLTTSIADDFIDREDNVTGTHMMLLYLFVFSSLRQPPWFSGEVLETYQRLIYPLVGAFLGDPIIPDGLDDASMEQRAERSGWRIGNFFETIVCGLTIDCDPATRSRLAPIGRAFGNWCSHLDDVVDVERDIRGGDTLTYPIYLLARHSPETRRAVQAADLSACLHAIGEDWFRDALVRWHRGHLRNLEAMARGAGFDRLADVFANLDPRVEDLIAEIRRENWYDAINANQPMTSAIALHG